MRSIRDFTSSKMPNNYHVKYGLAKDGVIDFFWYSYGKEIQKNVGTTNRLKNEGVKYTFGFNPVLSGKEGKTAKLYNDKNIRQALCQVDKNNFIIYTNISNDRS